MIHYFLKTFNKRTITKEARNRFPRKRNLSPSDVLFELWPLSGWTDLFPIGKSSLWGKHRWTQMINLINWFFVVCVVHWISRNCLLHTQWIFPCKNWQFTVRLYLWQSGKSGKLALKFLINEIQWSSLFGTNCFLIVYLSVEVFILVKYIYAYPLFNIVEV